MLSDLFALLTLALGFSILMHLLVLGAFCQEETGVNNGHRIVLMHLLVLGAFCLSLKVRLGAESRRLNAPSGAGCFLPCQRRSHSIV